MENNNESSSFLKVAETFLSNAKKITGDPEIEPKADITQDADPEKEGGDSPDPEDPVKVEVKKRKPKASITPERIQEIIAGELDKRSLKPDPVVVSKSNDPGWAGEDRILKDITILAEGESGGEYQDLRKGYIDWETRRRKFIESSKSEDGFSDESDMEEWLRKNPIPVDADSIRIEAAAERLYQKRNKGSKALEEEVRKAKMIPYAKEYADDQIEKLHSMELGINPSPDSGLPQWACDAITRGVDTLGEEFELEKQAIKDSFNRSGTLIRRYVDFFTGAGDGLNPAVPLDKAVLDEFLETEKMLISSVNGEIEGKKVIPREEYQAKIQNGAKDLSKYTFASDEDILYGFRYRALSGAISRVKEEEERIKRLGFTRASKKVQAEPVKPKEPKSPAPLPFRAPAGKTPQKTEHEALAQALKAMIGS